MQRQDELKCVKSKRFKYQVFLFFFSLVFWSLATLFWNNRQKTTMSSKVAHCWHVVFVSVKEDDEPNLSSSSCFGTSAQRRP